MRAGFCAEGERFFFTAAYVEREAFGELLVRLVICGRGVAYSDDAAEFIHIFFILFAKDRMGYAA